MPAFDWGAQVVVVTGASAGIGAALAREVGRRGASVVLAARRADKLDEVARSVVSPAIAVPTDVTRRADVDRLAEAALERFGHVDVWVNNAGRGISRHVLELTDDDVDAMIRDNVKSALYGMQAIVPHMQQRGRGQVVNVSSMLGRVPLASFRSAYGAAKSALDALTENLRVDLAEGWPEAAGQGPRDNSGIKVACVYPGVVTTDFGLNALGGGVDSRSLPGGQSPEQVANVVADAIAARRDGDVYTRPGAIERVLQHLRDLAGGT